jgi:AMP-binding enzyme/Phosphopantetheine attachment site/AMP-binding enzyme C-terminal domain
VNGYGPTECTTFSLWHLIDSAPDGVHSVPIGKPIANSTAYILDAARQLVPPGVVGEICLGGDGLAVGYHRRPELTRKLFLQNGEHVISGERLYCTGDKGRYLPNGAIEFHGRRDQQVKLRGHRIELGEIETALRQHEAVSEAVVTVWQPESGEKCLAAYVTSHMSTAPTGAGLKKFLASRLPPFMVPAVIVTLDRFPLTPVGKIDRSALPPVESFRSESDHIFTSETEEKIASIWRDVLKRQSISPDENFFDAGGTSLLLAAVQAQLSVKFENAPPITTLLQFPTVRSLARHLTGMADSKESLSRVQDRAKRWGDALRNSRIRTKQGLALHSMTRNQI